ncbi:MAG: protein kinase [Sandaracinaceae bacterium]
MVVLREIPTGSSQQFGPGDVLGGYMIERLIGVGGMADVYLARHKKLDKEVAIKVLRAHAQERSDLRARFLREGQAASRIRNPHVVEVFDVGSDGDVPYLVMQYLPGPTLEEHIAERGALDIQEAVHIFLPICAAVAAGHEEGAIHRDLKPENVILAIEGNRTRPTVLDFGVSRLITSDPRLTLDSSVVGTPHYMSPEQARGEAIDSKTDQYAVGVMLYQAVTSRLPRDRASVLELLNEVGHKGFEPPSEHRPSISRDFESVILKAMAPSRRDRFVTVYDLAGALLPFASESAQSFWAEELGIKPIQMDALNERSPQIGPETPTLPGSVDAPKPLPDLPPPNPRETESSSSRGPIWVALALLLIAAVGGAVYLFGGSTPEAYVVRLQTEPANATIEIDGEVVGQHEAALSFDADGTTHHLRVTAPNFETYTATFRDTPPSESVVLVPTASVEPGEVEPSEVEASEVEPGEVEPSEVEAPEAVEPAAEQEQADAPTVDVPSDDASRAARPAPERRASPQAPSRADAPPRAESEPRAARPTPPVADEAPEQGGQWQRPSLTENLDPWSD